MALPDPSLRPPDHASTVSWHAGSGEAAARQLGVDPLAGLSEDEAGRRLQQHGPNRLRERPGKPAWRRFGEQLAQPLVLVLIAAGTMTALLGEWVDAGVIFGVVLVNAGIGYWQEARAEGALSALARTLATPVTVRRGGQRRAMEAAGLVPGDVVVLSAGDRVPADLRLFQQKEMQIDEAALTGESLPVSKHTATLAESTRLADRANMAYAGTTVVAGQGCGLVIATGDATETGRIADLMATAPAVVTPLTRKMIAFSNLLLRGIGGLALLTFSVGLLRGESLFDMFMAAVALAVGAIPEGLPAAVTVTLAIGVARMARRRAIIRHLPAVETLGGTTVICSDKTGTLTENAMTVRALWCGGLGYEVGGHGYVPEGRITPFPAVGDAAVPEVDGDPRRRELLVAGALCNDASLRHAEGRWQITGDPTEAALIVLARKGGLDDHTLRTVCPRLDELPFDASRQFMATRHGGEAGDLVYVKGAVEKLLPRCDSVWQASGPGPAVDREAVEQAAHAMATQGLRVLLLARRSLAPGQPLDEAAVDRLALIGLVGMIDPPRAAAVRAIRSCHAAGIRVKMITGDHAVTALAIARQIGIPAGQVLSGRDLAGLDDAQLAATVATVDVFARVEPEQKLRLVGGPGGPGCSFWPGATPRKNAVWGAPGRRPARWWR